MKLKRNLTIIYETIMLLLVILSLTSILSQTSDFKYIHRITWFIFLIDIAVRFYKASKKLKYIRKNPFDIISIIPFEDLFILARFSRFLRLFRYKNAIKRYLDRISSLAGRYGFRYLTLAILILNALTALLVSRYSALSLKEGFIWSILNFFKFNHVSSHSELIILSIGLKIIGVLYMGVLLSKSLSVAKTIYETKTQKKSQN